MDDANRTNICSLLFEDILLFDALASIQKANRYEQDNFVRHVMDMVL